MNRSYFYIILLLSLASALLILFFFTQKQVHEKTQENPQVLRSPFPTHISGVGTLEPKSGNINIGIPFNRSVKEIKVSLNDHVKKGDILIELDNQDLIANLQIKQIDFETAVANLNKLQALPRKEDLAIAEESLKKAETDLNEAKTQYEMVKNLANPRAISKEESDKRLYKFLTAEASLLEAKANYEKIEAGAWKPDLEIAISAVKQARANVKAANAEVERTLIKSPIDGNVLQIKIHEGETPSSDPSKTVMIVGDIDQIYLRVSLDQFDLPFLQTNAKAIAYRQGSHSIEYPLEFIHIEPFMSQKKYLTNVVGEKVDTQVLEVLYRIIKNEPPLYIGEQMDVFIDVEKK